MSLTQALYATGFFFVLCGVLLMLIVYVDGRRARARRQRAEREKKAAEVLYPNFRQSGGQQ